MSFVDLLKNDVWSEADIVNHTESLVRSEFSLAAENILNRKIQGATLGQYTLTSGEMAELQRFALVTETARQFGTAARADMVLLDEVFNLEKAQRRLLLPLVEPITEVWVDPVTSAETTVITNQVELDTDAAERAAAQAVVAAASAPVNNLYLLRNPVPEVTPEVLP